MSQTAPDLHEAAAGWFLRSRAADWTQAEAARLERWLAADPRHRAAFDEVAAAWSASGEAAGSPGIQAMRAAALAARPRRRLDELWPRLAATLLVALALSAAGLGALRFFGAAPEVQVYRTDVGERATVVLADGSQATLNTASVLAVEYSRARRGLRLLAGEAWFDVAKNPRRPFVVTAGAHSVTATGTSFDVRLDADGLRVAVSEGGVLVAAGDRTPLAALTAGQRAEVRGGSVIVANAGPISGDWRSGRLQFDAVTLADASAEMNRYRRTPIVLADSEVARLRISGVFEAGEGSGFLEALPLMHPVAVVPTPEAVRIVSKAAGKTPAGR